MSKGAKKGSEEAAKCPKCEENLHLVDKLGQHYCFSCETYVTPVETKTSTEVQEHTPAPAAPEPAKEEKPAKEETVPCPSCGDQTAPVKDSDRFYCYACEQYVSGSGEVIEEPKKIEGTPLSEPKPEHVEEELPEAPKAEAVCKVEEPKPESAPEPAPAETVEPAPEKIAPPEEEKEPEKASEEEEKSCPYCECELTYVPKYDRWYCYKCRKYAPKEQTKPAAKEAKKCPSCGNDSQYIEKYQRWYCWSCQRYLPKDIAVVPAKPRADQGPLCAQCGRSTAWVPVYERHYCYPCQKYTPKAEGKKEPSPAPPAAKVEEVKPAAPVCARCGKTTTWIAKYERYYCYPCQKYVSKEQPKEEEKKTSGPKTVPLCAKCGKPTTWIAKYERHYCYPCNKYAPK